jgi:hypothetical protein
MQDSGTVEKHATCFLTSAAFQDSKKKNKTSNWLTLELENRSAPYTLCIVPGWVTCLRLKSPHPFCGINHCDGHDVQGDEEHICNGVPLSKVTLEVLWWLSGVLRNPPARTISFPHIC